MRWRQAGDSDLPQLHRHLSAQVDHAMFPLSNLLQYGLGSDAPRGMTFWISDAGVFGLTNAGMAMPVAPGGDWPALVPWIDRPLIGILGETTQARALQRVCGLANAPVQHDADEPAFALPLDDLIIPGGDTRLTPILEASRDICIAWRTAYHVETLHTPADRAPAIALREIDSYISTDSHRVLWQGDTPVAMTGFNAILPDIVQIGGVYTPPALRCRGLARRAVALHLAEARSQGVRRAVLFAANENAARAYTAIGFTGNGGYSMILFQGAQGVQ